jgi:hypothetical protein
MSVSKRQSFYSNLNLQRCLLMSSPFWLAAAASQEVGAVTHNVTTMAQLRTAVDAVNAAGSNDIINLAAGTYTLTGAALDNANASGDLDITKAAGTLNIVGAATATTILDGATLDRVFHINAAGGLITIQNLTIQNGRAADDGSAATDARGGGIMVQQGNLTLDGVVLSNNSAVGANGSVGSAGAPASSFGFGASATGGPGGTGGSGSSARGGGIHFAGGTLQIISSGLTGNTAVGGTGGAGGAGGNAIGNYSISGGVGGTGGNGGTGEGGGIFVAAGTLDLVRSTVSGGGATGGAGGAGGAGGNAGGIADLTTFANMNGGSGGTGGAGGSGSGGGVFIGAGTVNVTNSTLSGSSVLAGNGGSGGNGGNASGISSVSTVNNNGGGGGSGGSSGNSQGGGAFVSAGTVAISNSTIASATATAGVGGSGGAGGSGTNPGSSGSSGSSTISSGGGVFVSGGGALTVVSSIFADSVADSNSDIEGTYTADNSLIENGQAPASGTGNVTGTDPGLAALANNGGPTQTHAITGASAAANVGTNPLALTTDQRGTGFVRVSGAAADMGAFEFQTGGGGQTATPSVTNPAAPVTVNAATFNVQGSATADSVVRIYSDLNNNGVIDGADAVVGTQTLTGGATAFSVSVPLTQDAANNFTATADDPTNTESTPANVPTITEDSTAPAGPVVTTPATPVNTTGATFNIIGTAEANSMVQIYSDANNNGVIDGADAVVASGTATGGNFNISTPITQGTANNFTATAEDATANESGPTDVPTITETTAVTASPVVTTPSGAVTVNQANFDIEGTAVADSVVRIYSDANNNGLIDGLDAVVGTQTLTGGGTNFSISVTLTQNAANNFTATADSAADPESNPVNGPTITDNTGGGNGDGGDGGGGGGCSTGDSPRSGWLAFGAMFAALFAGMRQAFRRKQS